MLNMKNNIQEQSAPKITWDDGTTQTPRNTTTNTQTSSLPIPQEEVKTFQQFVYDTDMDKNLLGPAGVDGKWGPKTQAAWNKYKDIYTSYKANKPKSGGATASGSTENAEATLIKQQNEDTKFFRTAISKGQLKKGGKVVKLPTGQIAYMIDAASVGDSKNQGNYFFLKNGTWVLYNGKEKVDSGDYTLDELVFDEPVAVAEQKITRRDSEQQPTSSKEATPQQPATNEDTATLKQFLGALGIPYDTNGVPLPTVDMEGIYAGVLDSLNKGWQSVYFGYFKKALTLLQKKGKYQDLNVNDLINKYQKEDYKNFPESGVINQLSNPQNVEDVSWEKRSISKLVGNLPNVQTPAYKWTYLVTTEESGAFSLSSIDEFKTINFEKIDNEGCLNAVAGWSRLATELIPVPDQEKKRIVRYLQSCNSQCLYTNKDKSFVGRTFTRKAGSERLGEILNWLSRLNGQYGPYKVVLPNMDQACKERAKMARKAEVGGMAESLDKKLKTTIKENLLTIKENKQRLLKEEKIIKNRLFVISEDSKKLKSQEDYNRLFNSLLTESNFLLNNGFNEKVINESIFDLLGKIGLGGIADTLQEKFMEWVLTQLNINKESYFGNVLIAAFGNLELTNISKILSGDCSSLVKLIAKSAVEGLIRKKTTKGGETNYFEGILRNAIDNFLESDKDGLIRTIEDKLTEFICPALSGVTSKFSGLGNTLKEKLVG